MRQKTKLPFNPDTMTVSDLKNCAHTLRSLLERYEQLATSEVNGTTMAEELYTQIMQIDDAYEVV